MEDDTSYYSAIILEFVKNGEKDQTDCWFQVRQDLIRSSLTP